MLLKHYILYVSIDYRTVILGYQSILCGDNEIVVAGGQECMSKAPHAMHMRNGVKLGEAKFVDTILSDGLTDAIYNIHMGDTGKFLRIHTLSICACIVLTFSLRKP